MGTDPSKSPLFSSLESYVFPVFLSSASFICSFICFFHPFLTSIFFHWDFYLFPFHFPSFLSLVDLIILCTPLTPFYPRFPLCHISLLTAATCPYPLKTMCVDPNFCS